MTISSQVYKMIYTGNGSTVVFPYSFKIFENTDLEVILHTIATGAETTLALTTHYTVSGAGDDNGGNVTTVSTYSSDYKLIIRRDLDLTQETDYVENDPFAAETHEDTVDRLTMIAQQLQEQVSRTILQGPLETDQITFPSAEASKLIGWDSSGVDLENVTNPAVAAESSADDAAASAVEAADSATAAAISAAAADGTTGTFTNSDLSSGVLTITHTLGLSTPYIIDFGIADNNHRIIDPDEVTYGANTVTVDLSSYGTIAGTWSYLYGGSPSSAIPLPDPTASTALDQLRVNAGQTAYETFTPSNPLTTAYPVGSIYITTVSTNPNTVLGFGTWVAFGEGQVLVGYDSGDADFGTPGGTGGAKTVTLTAAQSGLPAHAHAGTFNDNGTNNVGSNGNGQFGSTDSVASAPASEAHTNLAPYVTVYMFTRTA